MAASDQPLISSSLSPAQNEAIQTLIARLVETRMDRMLFRHEIDKHAAVLNSAFPTDDDLWALGRELERWVRWTRVTGHCLAYAFQYAALHRASASFVLAASLFADSQAVIGDGLAVSSLESAWGSAHRSYPSATALLNGLQFRLKIALDAYEEYRHRAAFADRNPLSQNLYCTFSYWWLKEARESGDTRYAGIVGHRFRGLELEVDSNWDAALAEYEAGLAAAMEGGLEAEVGHMMRHRGYALRCLKRYAESAAVFREACRWEAAPAFLYWRALSQHELALSLGYCASTRADYAEALKTFHEARRSFDAVLATSMPEVRDVQQEMVRVFHENALHIAVELEEHGEALALIEACGARQVTEAIAESVPRWQPEGVAPEEFRQTRAAYYRQMDSYSQGIEHYLAELPGNYIQRKNYLIWRGAMLKPLALASDSDRSARLLLEATAPGCVFVLPHVGMNRTWISAVDMESHQVRTVATDQFTATHAKTAYANFSAALQVKSSIPGDDSPRLRAVDGLLDAYAGWFVPLLRELLEGSGARHIKFFSREDMNPVPLHALPWDAEDRLIDHYEISYGQTLGMWLLGRERPASQHSDCPFLAVDAGALRFYTAALAEVTSLHQPSWPEFLAKVKQWEPVNLLFACHGDFDPEEPSISRLKFGGPNGVSFYQLFAELDLEKCASVILGACYSGLIRSRVGAEYCGLQMAFLAAGARNVVASLWPVNQLSTAMLSERLAGSLAHDNVCEALRKAETEIRNLTSAEVAHWLQTKYAAVDPLQAPLAASLIGRLGPRPFAHPYYWAGFTSMGAE